MKTWRYIRNTMGIVGALCLYSAVGASDYFAEIGQASPVSVWQMVCVGFLLIAPTVIHMGKAVRG